MSCTNSSRLGNGRQPAQVVTCHRSRRASQTGTEEVSEMNGKRRALLNKAERSPTRCHESFSKIACRIYRRKCLL